MKNLIEVINKLKKQNKIVGFKTSFEDEGVCFEDFINLRIATASCRLPLYVKIGGCEAKTDIINCNNYNIDGVVAPMIESEFAVEKFINCCDSVGFEGKRFINVETKTCVSSLEDILGSPSSLKIDGFTIGRSDLVASLGLSKKSVNSSEIYDVVRESFQKIKMFDFVTTMGGNLTPDSKKFIENLFTEGLLDKVETRNVIMKLSEENIFRIDSIIEDALFIEACILEARAKRTKLAYDQNIVRLKNIKGRIR